jgi:hypothetical protein
LIFGFPASPQDEVGHGKLSEKALSTGGNCFPPVFL